ncbi:MAG: glycosyltransferase family 2 protein [Deltaproteobacteria bacterium]|nr:glycosyltransferase family 2 protein [Deltaproteobacteria bacterium]
MSNGSPKVTVFMPVHNREPFVEESIGSVLAQSFRDFELLVIDDGSTDESAARIRAIDDPRIRLVHNEENLGIPRTRNRGLELARGEYIALLDSDDFAYPNRLALQVDFLDRNAEICAVGGWAHRISRDGRPRSPIVRPISPRQLRGQILFATCFKNPTMMARMSVMREFGYRDEFVYCQDIDLWARMSKKYPLANLPEFLIRYRLGGDSHQSESLARNLKSRVARDQLHDLGIEASESELEGHQRLRNLNDFEPTAEFIDWSRAWLLRLIESNARHHCHPEPEFSQAAAERWYLLLLAAGPRFWPTRLFSTGPFARALPGVLGNLARRSGQVLARYNPLRSS